MKGTIYKNGNRYWWKVKLPGEDKIRQIPLVPAGGKYATKDKAVAEEIAKEKWRTAVKGKTLDNRTIEGLVDTYMRHCSVYYRQSREAENIRYALNFLVANATSVYAEDLGPLELQMIRDAMIEKGLSRSTINKRMGMIKRMYRWAASQQLVPVTTFQALATVENLKAGRSNARETKKVRPVKEAHVYAILPYLSPVGRAMVRLQLLTGMRSTELCTMRPVDIDTSGRIWIYRPRHHKTSYRGHDRFIAIGPKGQAILRPFLKRKIDDYCFKPAESAGNNSNYNACYNRNSYRRLITRAIAAANRDGANIPHWHPHQLRHTAGTAVRKELGKEAARAFLGHKNPKVTDNYAEIDMSLALKAALNIG